MSEAEEAPLVQIHYRRPPDHVQVYVQRLLHEDEQVRITYEPHLPLPDPKWIGGALAMEPGSPVLWFTFPDAWHDIGRFHTVDGTYTGLYANILTPPVFEDRLTWRTTDLFLDVWIPSGGAMEVLDRDQFQDAVDQGVVSAEQAHAAESEVARIEAAARRGLWPPEIVREWDLARARAEI